MRFSAPRRVFAAALSALVVACSSAPTPDARSASAPAPPAASATPAPAAPASAAPAPAAVSPLAKGLVGTWEYQGAKLTFNSKGRVKMHFGDPPCLGKYTLDGTRLSVAYDAGTKGCTWGSPEGVRLKEPSLDIGPVTYTRVDSKDDTSF